PKIGPFTLYHIGLDVSYTIDAFGGSRRELESLQAAVEARRYELDAAQLALTANVVTSAIRQARLRDQIAITRGILAAEARALPIGERRFALGGVAGAEVPTQRGPVAQTRASIPPLERDLAQATHALAIYTGVPPGDANLPAIELADLTLPRDVPVVV